MKDTVITINWMQDNLYRGDGDYNDPHAIAVLILRIKSFLGRDYHRDLTTADSEILAEASNSKITYHSALNNFNRKQIGTIVPRIYFLRSETLSNFTKFLELGSWHEFRSTVDSIVVDLPLRAPSGSTALEAHLDYQKKVYKVWKTKIEEAIGVPPVPIVEDEEILAENKEENRDSASNDSPGASNVKVFRKKAPVFIGEERRKGLDNQALYLTNPDKPLVIIGMAGSGKTNFAENLIEQQEVVDTYGECRFMVYCEAEVNADFFFTKLHEQIQAPQTNGKETLEKSILMHLGMLEGKKLIILDNFDTCYDNYFDEIKVFLEILQGQAVIVYTMRSHIGPQQIDYTTYLVPSLSEAEAIELFNYHSNPKFERSEKDQEYLRDLVGPNVAGYLPLAIKLIAKQAEAVSQLSILYEDWLENRIEMMSIEGSENKNLNLISSISFSFKSPRLKHYDRSLLKALCEFPAPVLKGRGIIRKNIKGGFNMLTRLIGVALVEESLEGDLNIHPMIREYMRRQNISPMPYVETLSNNYVERADNYLMNSAIEASDSLNIHWANLCYSLTRVIDTEEGIQIISFVSLYSLTTGMYDSMIPLLRKASKVAKENGWTMMEANCLDSLGLIADLKVHNDEAKQHHDEAWDLYSQLKAPLYVARELERRGKMSFKEGKDLDAKMYIEDALEIHCLILNNSGQSSCLYKLGDIALRSGNANDAEQKYQEALELATIGENTFGVANCLARLATVSLKNENKDKAIGLYEDARDLYRELHLHLGEARCLTSLAEIFSSNSNHPKELEYYKNALELYGQIRMSWEEAECLLKLGDVTSFLGNNGEAEEYYERAIPLFRQTLDTSGEAYCLQSLGMLSETKGNYEDAERFFLHALNLYEQIEEFQSAGFCCYSLAGSHKAVDRYNEAQQYYCKAKRHWLNVERQDLIEKFLPKDLLCE